MERRRKKSIAGCEKWENLIFNNISDIKNSFVALRIMHTKLFEGPIDILIKLDFTAEPFTVSIFNKPDYKSDVQKKKSQLRELLNNCTQSRTNKCIISHWEKIERLQRCKHKVRRDNTVYFQ